jgi:hypothetical protein
MLLMGVFSQTLPGRVHTFHSPNKRSASLVLTYDSHLLDKIQALGRATFFKKPETIDGQPVPAPVKRRLLI